MHIAVVTRDMRGGGAQRVIAQLLKNWSSQGVQTTLISVYPNDVFYTLPEQTAHLCITASASNGNVDKLVRYKQLRRQLQELQPDVVLALPEEIGIYVVLAMLGTGIPVVVSERNNPWVMPDKKISRIARRLAYPFVKGLIFQTKQAASFFPQSQQKKGIVLPNPLEDSRLPQVFEGERERIVISAGRLEKQKNFPLLIQAFAKFVAKHPDYRLVIYGEGSLRPELEALAARLLPEGSWELPGQVNDLAQRLGRAELFAFSSDYEGVPNVLIEAMAVGTPSVSTDCAPGGAAELIENGVNGLLTEVGNAQMLADALCRLAEDPESAKQMARRAVDIRQKLDADRVCRDWLTYLQSIAKRKGGRK